VTGGVRQLRLDERHAPSQAGQILLGKNDMVPAAETAFDPLQTLREAAYVVWMTRLFRLWLMISTLLPAAMPAAVSASPRNAAAEVQIADDQYNRALERSDISALRQMIADTYVFTDPTGRVRNKDQVIKGIENGRIKIQSQTTRDVRIAVLGNAAIETGLVTSVAMRDGRNSGGAFRFTRVWIKRGRRWRTVAFQETAPQEPPVQR
jgi:ketosteroid isomerase-like protein